MYLFFLNLHCILQFSLGSNQYIVWVAQVCQHTWAFCAIFFGWWSFCFMNIYLFLKLKYWNTLIVKISHVGYEKGPVVWCQFISYWYILRWIFQGESCLYAALPEVLFFKMMLELHAFPSKSLAACEKYVVKVICECVRISHCAWEQKFHLSNDLDWRGQKNM